MRRFRPPAKLDQAYRATRYRAKTPLGTLTLRIGRRSRKLDALLKKYRMKHWLFVSAQNPYPKRCSPAVNEALHARLLERVKASKCRYFEGEGVAPDRSFAERSLLILGPDRTEATKLGVHLGQCAIVVGTGDEPAELVYCIGAPLPDDLVYGEFPEGELVFIPRAAAELNAERWDAATTAETWGELRELSPTAYAELTEAWARQQGDDTAIDDDTPFDRYKISAVCDYDWPEWPSQEMRHWMPDDILEGFGGEEFSAVSGDFLVLRPEDTKVIVKRLEAQGYRCVKDQKLVARACGG